MTPTELYSRWFRDTASRLRAGDPPPRTPGEARRIAGRIRRKMLEAGGKALLAKSERAPLDSQVLGTLRRDGYAIERLIFQTRPGCFATANVYVPEGKGPFPAVLGVHGHWAGARRDPVVQSRCIGLAKLGFVTLTLDAWGAGERGTQPGRNEYHGGLLGASLWPVGTPLHGLQLQDNIRALDYLQSRPDVDGKRIGCTGASGGGNQTTYLSAFDTRIGCAVPVCSVGTLASYLDTACCVDEVLLGALTFTEEGDLLGLVAPRALLVITADKDAYHFGPIAAKEALDRARHYFGVHAASEKVKHGVFDSGHDYSRPMREAMYGWMTRWLKGEGDGSPIPEPAFSTEDPAVIRCFDPASRPARVMITVTWVRKRAAEQAERGRRAAAGDWKKERGKRVAALRRVLALPGRRAQEGLPSSDPSRYSVRRAADEWLMESEPGIRIPVSRMRPDAGEGGQAPVLLLHPLGRGAALASGLGGLLVQAGRTLIAPELRGCGEMTLPNQSLGEAIPDHNLVEWSLLIGRPLLGQWVHDVLALAAESGPVQVVGWREAGLAALLAAALDSRITAVTTVETLATYVSDTPPHNQRMVAFQPDILSVGDVSLLAALSAPRPVLLANPARLDGMPLSEAEAAGEGYGDVRSVYTKLDAAGRFAVRPGMTDADIATVMLSVRAPAPAVR